MIRHFKKTEVTEKVENEFDNDNEKYEKRENTILLILRSLDLKNYCQHSNAWKF